MVAAGVIRGGGSGPLQMFFHGALIRRGGGGAGEGRGAGDDDRGVGVEVTVAGEIRSEVGSASPSSSHSESVSESEYQKFASALILIRTARLSRCYLPQRTSCHRDNLHGWHPPCQGDHGAVRCGHRRLAGGRRSS